MKSLEWALIQADWCPYKKRSLGHELVQGEDHMKTPDEDGHLQSKERGCGMKPTLLTH